jgi:hypothetical protein
LAHPHFRMAKAKVTKQATKAKAKATKAKVKVRLPRLRKKESFKQLCGNQQLTLGLYAVAEGKVTKSRKVVNAGEEDCALVPLGTGTRAQRHRVSYTGVVGWAGLVGSCPGLSWV